jgi:hypothetical protein
VEQFTQHQAVQVVVTHIQLAQVALQIKVMQVVDHQQVDLVVVVLMLLVVMVVVILMDLVAQAGLE